MKVDLYVCWKLDRQIRQASIYGRTLSDASMLYFADVFFIFFFMTALVGQTAERIFTKLSHVVDIRCYL